MDDHILLVEHDVKLAQFIELELTNAGFQLSVAYDALTALSLAQMTLPILVIFDLALLHQISALETFQMIQATNTRMPIIFLTAMDQDEAKMQANKINIETENLLFKPFSIDELLFRIQISLVS